MKPGNSASRALVKEWGSSAGPQPGPLRRLLDRPPAVRPLVVPSLREDDGAGHPGDNPFLRLEKPATSTPPERTTSTATSLRLSISSPGTSQGFPDASVSSSRTAAARRTTGVAAAAWLRTTSGRPVPELRGTYSSTPASPTGGHQPTAQGRRWKTSSSARRWSAPSGVGPETGLNYDDTKRYVDATPNLSEADRR